MGSGSTGDAIHHRLTPVQLPAGASAVLILERGQLTMLLDAAGPPRAVNAAAAELTAAIAAIPARTLAARVRAAGAA